jgi:diaminopimelate epimerase
MRTWSFAKGHGTANDFVIVKDRHAMLNPTTADVRYLCDRRLGVGGDGLLRAVRAVHMPEWTAGPDLWFMDYRNADGSIAELCGNGARVFARYLLEENLVSGDVIPIATRAGLIEAVVERDGQITVGLGQATRQTDPVAVTAAGRTWLGHKVEIGNPHCVIRLTAGDDLDTLDLASPPQLPVENYPAGGNVEFVEPVDAHRLRLRVWERGVGETQSCGTGVVAAVRDHLATTGDDTGSCHVSVPGGALSVYIAAEGQAHLTGPAVIVARGEVVLPHF